MCVCACVHACVCVCSSLLSADAVLDVSSAAGRRRWLHVVPDWNPQNMFPLQGLLEKRGCVCVRVCVCVCVN